MSLPNLIARETQRFIETHPKSAAHAGALKEHWLFGAPFHWMNDWAAPTAIIAEDGEGAVLTDAHQLNKNLLLSSEATANTKPQLEIFADDVKCAHGATVGQLEDEELFYLAARGIPTDRARALLTYGFAEDVISKIKLKSVREQLDRMVLDKLHQSLEVN